MIALFPPADVAAQLAITSALPSGATAVPAEELHVTLAYFPTDDQATIDAATAAAARLAYGFGPVQATVTGWAELIAGSNGEPHVILLDSEYNALDEMQEYLGYCCVACGCQPASDHGFLPHMTVAYTKAGEETEVGEDYPPITISFTTVTVKFGDMRHDFMLGGAQTYPSMMMSLREKVAALLTSDKDEEVQSSRVSRQTEGDVPREQDTATGKAQWTTAYINDLPDSAFLYVEDGDKDADGKTTPRSLRHFPVKDADGKVDIPHLRNALARIPQSNAPGLNKDAVTKRAQSMLADAQKEGKRLGSQMLGKISAAISSLGEFMKWAQYDEGDQPPPDEKQLSEHFFIRKQADGTHRWFSYSSNGFEDREGEIVSTKALEDTVAYGDATDDRGSLRLFHIPGTDIGTCDFQAMEGRFLIESGVIGDSDLATKALKYFLKTEEQLGVSIGFLFPQEEFKDNVYGAIRIVERSVLPIDAAANPWTAFQTLKGGAMDDRKQAFLNTVTGDEKLAADRIQRAGAMTKTLEGVVAFKEQSKDDSKGDETPTEGALQKAMTDAVAAAMEPVAEAIKAVAEGVVARFDAMDARLKAIEEANTSSAKAAEETAAAATKAAEAAEEANKPPAGAATFRATESKENETPASIVEKLLGKTEAGMNAQAKAIAPYVADLFAGSRGQL